MLTHYMVEIKTYKYKKKMKQNSAIDLMCIVINKGCCAVDESIHQLINSKKLEKGETRWSSGKCVEHRSKVCGSSPGYGRCTIVELP